MRGAAPLDFCNCVQDMPPNRQGSPCYANKVQKLERPAPSRQRPGSFLALLALAWLACAALLVGPAPARAQVAASLDWFGPTLLPKYRIVSYYGNPLSATMGVLGQGTTQEMLARLAAQEQAYQTADPGHKVIGALELVAVVAQRSPGPQGYYSSRMPYSVIQGELDLARSHHLLLILDVQIGHATVQNEVQYLAPFLRQPDVELALDPEFAMLPGDIPGVQFGSMPTPPINWALQYLQSLTVRYHLPQKILILHQFIESMVPDWQQIQEQPDVVLVRDLDGFGGWQLKSSEYERFIQQEAIPYVVPFKSPLGVRGALNGFYVARIESHFVVAGGMKLFYTQDHPLATPAMVLALDPPPLVVIYQ